MIYDVWYELWCPTWPQCTSGMCLTVCSLRTPMTSDVQLKLSGKGDCVGMGTAVLERTACILINVRKQFALDRVWQPAKDVQYITNFLLQLWRLISPELAVENSFTHVCRVHKVDENCISYMNASVFIKSILEMGCFWFGVGRFGSATQSFRRWPDYGTDVPLYDIICNTNTYIIGLARNHINKV